MQRHDLRHTLASWHVQSGTPLHVLKELGGWADLTMVLRYAHLSSSEHLSNYANNSKHNDKILPEQQTILDLVQQALADYRQQLWDKSEATFHQLHDLKPDDKLYKIYLERIEHYRETPPEENWDGAFTHTIK